MKAIIQTERERGGVEVGERKRPEPGPDEALVRVHTAGLCGSDVHAYKYVPGYEFVDVPRIMGHEYAGEVVEVGSDVTTLSPGTKVVEEPIHDCGECFQCKNGQSNVCRNFEITGFHRDGAWREYHTVEAHHLHEIPDDVPLSEAALTEPTSIATRAVLERSLVTPGDDVLVEGPGPIGVLTALVADSVGTNVYVSGLGRDAEYRLPLVEEQGLTAIDVEKTDLGEVAERETVGGGFDVVFDMTGHHTGVEVAAEHVRKGGQIVVVGLPGSDSELFVTPLVRGEVSLDASYGSVWRNFEQALRLMENGSVDPTAIMEPYDPDDPVTAFEEFLDGAVCKPTFRFGE